MKLNIIIAKISTREALLPCVEKFNIWPYRHGEIIIKEQSSYWILNMELGDFATFWKQSLHEFPKIREELHDACVDALHLIEIKTSEMGFSLKEAYSTLGLLKP
jgi:hypothetical protein